MVKKILIGIAAIALLAVLSNFIHSAYNLIMKNNKKQIINMKIIIVFILFYLSSCRSSIDNSELVLKKMIGEYVNLIGKNVPNDFSHESEYEYTKKIEINQENPAGAFVVLNTIDSGVVESCTVTIFLSDFYEARQYYDKLLEHIEKDDYRFIKYISKYKRPYGKLYSKEEMFFGIYEPAPLAIPMCLSKNMNMNNFYEDEAEMIFDINYYKNKIIEHRNFFDERQQISTIIEVNNIIPGLLCFLVCWDDSLKGYIYELYAFDEKHNVVNKYLVGYGPKINNLGDILMEKLPGNRIEHELISFGDFNNDGSNEILSYSFYPNIGYVFTVFGYRLIENEFSHTCLIPIYINFEKPFSPVEFTNNGFKILEVIDNEYLELAWNEYKWNTDTKEYLKE